MSPPSGNLKPPSRFWLKSERGLLVQVSTVGYEDDNVGNFVKAIVASKVWRTQLELPDRLTLTLHITETANALCDDLPLAHILMQPGYAENSAEKPLVVVIKMEQQSKRRRLDRRISQEQSSSFVLSDFFLKESGLNLKTHSLFCRSQFWNQFEFLDMVLHTPRPGAMGNENPNFSGWILGSPGTGKSKTTLAFLSTIDRVRWKITWIHLKPGAASCYQVVDNDIRIRHTDLDTGRLRWQPEDIERILLEKSDVGRHHIVVVDGIRNDDRHRAVSDICVGWLGQKYKERRLVFVSSMASRGKSKEDEDSMAGAKEFLVDSWSWDDYIHAVNNKDFYNNIRERLDSSGCEDLTSPEDLLKSKYFFAGGCPRLMFDYETAEVMEILTRALTSVPKLMRYVEDYQGERSKAVTNRLLIGSYDECGMRVTSIVSKYAATLVAVRLGPKIITALSKVLTDSLNPSMRGWLVEMWFFASLPRKDFTFTVNGEKTTWPKSTFVDFDPRSITKVPNDGVWWKPKKWNEGGYDAVYVERKSNLVRFVQATTAERYSLKLQCFKAFMEKLKDHMETTTLEIYFLFQDKEGATQIREPKEVSGPGSLKEFSGWEQGREWRNVRKGLFKCPIPYD
ncbi:unnamed protein product [Calypogeia fissa]